MENTLNVRLRLAVKTLDGWKNTSTIPKLGEICLEADSANPPINYKMKIGDGTLPYYDSTPGAVMGIDYLPYFSAADTGGNDLATVITTWIASNLDVSEYALAEWSNNKLYIYGIKEVDGKIEKGSNSIALTVGNLLSISENNGVVTLSHDTVQRTDTNNNVNLADLASVVTGVTTDSYGHITGITTYKLPVSVSKNIIGKTSGNTSDDASASNVYLNHLENNQITSSHKISGGTKINVSSDSSGNVDITHESQSLSNTTGSQLSFGSDVISSVSVDGTGHITGKTTSALPSNPVNAASGTLNQIMVSDGDNTTSTSGKTVTTTAPSNNSDDTTIPTSKAVNSAITSALTYVVSYKGTILDVTDLPTSNNKIGDEYVASDNFSVDSAQESTYKLAQGYYEIGDRFLWNGSSWDSVSGENQVSNSNPTIKLDGSTYIIGTVDGTNLTIKTLNLDLSDPSASGSGLTFIDTVSQIDGLLSATKKTVLDATTSQKGVVQLASSHNDSDESKSATGKTVKDAIDGRFVLDIHYNSESNKVASAKQTWDEFEKRNVQFIEAVPIEDFNLDEELFILRFTYGIGWDNNAATCTKVGGLKDLMPIHKSLRACVNQIVNESVTVDGVVYNGKRKFLYWLDDDDWTKQYNSNTASTLDGTNNTNISIYNRKFYYKSFKNISSNSDHSTSGTYNEFLISPYQFDNTWTLFKEGYTDFAKMQVVNNVARSFGDLDFSVNNPRDNGLSAADFKTWISSVPSCDVTSSLQYADTYALNSGAHLLTYDEYKILFYWLPAIEFGTFEIESNTIFDWDSNNWSGHTVSRDSLNLSDGNYGYCGFYSENQYLNESYVYGTCAFIPSGYTNALGTNTGWVKIKILKNGNGHYEKIVSRWRGFEILRNIGTTLSATWGMINSAGKCEVFSTKNRSQRTSVIPVKYVSSGNIIGTTKSDMPVWPDPLYTTVDDFLHKGCYDGIGVGKEFDLGTDGNIIFSSVGGNKYDYATFDTAGNQANPHLLFMGGDFTISSNAGPAYMLANKTYTSTNNFSGYRCRWNVDEYTSIIN